MERYGLVPLRTMAHRYQPEAAAVPARGSLAFRAPKRAASTRLICPAPTPTVCVAVA